MGGLVSSLGFGSNQGTNFQASGTGLQSPVTAEQAETAYGRTQRGLDQQLQFLTDLQAQHGIQNQTDVYNRLNGVVNGTGPNPAAAMLANATGANTANQAALMAAQRGTGANPGLIARQAAQQGAALQQNAAGQGALMQAQQSLGALNMQGGLSTQQVGQQAAATNAYSTAAQNEQQNLLNSIAARNNVGAQMQGNINSANAGINNTIAQGQQGLAGSFMGGIGSVLGFAQGGQVPNYDNGGPVTSPMITPKDPTLDALVAKTVSEDQPKSNVGRFIKGFNDSQQGMQGSPGQNAGAAAISKGSSQMFSGIGKGLGSVFGGAGGGGSTAMAGGAMDAGSVAPVAMMASHGGKVPAMVSPGEGYLTPDKASAVANKSANPMREAEKIPGKAKVKGDSPKNDTVSKTLESGGVVIPRSIMESKDAAKKAAAFVTAHLARSKKGLPQKA